MWWIRALVIIGFAGVTTFVAAQTRLAALKPALATLDEGFTRVTSLRELGDGRVLLVDEGEQRLVAVDFVKQTVELISRPGQGPGEYQEITRIHALGGDSSLVEDRRGLRWIIFVGTKPVRTMRTQAGVWRGPTLVGADSFGNVLELRGFSFRRTPGVPFLRMQVNAESILVLRHQRTVGTSAGVALRTDTLARLRGAATGEAIVPRGTINGTPINYHLPNPLGAEEQAVMFLDGWVAFALTEPYRIGWQSPGGSRIAGPALPFTRVPVDDRQKRAASARAWPRVRPAFEPDQFPPWPPYLPPFLNDALLALPDGRLLVERTPNALVDRKLYDIVDRRGHLGGQVAVKPNERIVGFGASSVYVVTKDADDVEWLSRHPWP